MELLRILKPNGSSPLFMVVPTMLLLPLQPLRLLSQMVIIPLVFPRTQPNSPFLLPVVEDISDLKPHNTVVTVVAASMLDVMLEIILVIMLT